MKIIEQTYAIKAPLRAVWDALTDPEQIEGWGGGPAVMRGEAGTTFKLWGGDIHGSNTKVVKGSCLEQDWFGGDWDKPSQVKFELTFADGITSLHLTQSGVPEAEVDDIDDGWKRYYLGPLKEFVEAR